jgi:putative hydrolase of the HAD superfamily
MARTTIDVVAFDYGNVLSRPQDPACVREMAELSRLPVDEFMRRYYRHRPPYDRGVMSAPEYWTGLLREGGVSATPGVVEQLMRADAASWLRFDDRVVAWARQLKAAGRPIAILSNMPYEILAELRSAAGWLAEFGLTIFSCEVKSVKPEAVIYRRLLDALGREGSRVLFIDDAEQNVQGAARAGLHAIRYESLEALQREVQGRFVLHAER